MFGCFRLEEIRGKDNETGLKEGGGIEMSTLQCFPYTRCTRSLVIDMSNYSAFHIRDARSLVIEMSIYSAFHIRDAPLSFALYYSPPIIAPAPKVATLLPFTSTAMLPSKTKPAQLASSFC